MTIPHEAIAFENQSIGPAGEPTIAAAYDILVGEWEAGQRSRELGLHLMFLAWFLLVEPPHLTGLSESATGHALVFDVVHEYFKPTIHQDPEMLYVVGLMAHVFPYFLNDEEKWAQLSREYRLLYRQQAPEGIDPSIFTGRGAYGHYFSGHAALKDGY